MMKGTHIVKLLSTSILLVILFGVTFPALADYLGPDRTRTESYVDTYDWGVWAKPDPTGNSCNHTYGIDCVVCTWERNPGSPCGDATYWYKVGTRSEVVERTVTYPEATINGALNGCNLRNGWCSTSPILSLSAAEPVAGYAITLIEGTRNGETFACQGSSCDVPLLEGENIFTFWALSSWGDSSRMGNLTARVDTQPPHVNGELSGMPGENGWYVSPVTFRATASDPAPGSGLQALTYSLDGGAWTPYADPLTVSDGVHTITFRAEDSAGHVAEASASVQVDTQPPALQMALDGEQVNGWYLSRVVFTVLATDGLSGLARIEYALDGSGWQTYTAPLTIGDGQHSLRVRAFDQAGNVSEAAPLTFQVDGTPPRIQLPESWYIWENGEVTVSDGQSGLSSVEIEIRDPQGRWEKVHRVYDANGQPFSTDITWDRRFGDGTLAPIGMYQVVVKAFDLAGNMSQETAHIVIPAPGVTPTALPTHRVEPVETRTPLPTFTATPETSQITADAPTLTPARTPMVATFSETVVQSVHPPIPQSQSQPLSKVLWGAAAAAAIGAATAYALEQRRKRKEEEARQLAEAQAEAACRNAAEEARKVQNWLQGKALLEAQLREAEKAGASQEQIVALRQTGSTKGLGAALAAATVAIRLLLERNRAQSQNPPPSSFGGEGKGLASLVPQPYLNLLTPADDEPPTFLDKLKQLWDAFWNWLTGKSQPAIATPSPTLHPSQVFVTPAPTPTITLSPTSTPIPYQQYKTTSPLTEWELRAGGQVAHNAHQLLAQASQFYFWSNDDPGGNTAPPVPPGYDKNFPISVDPNAYKFPVGNIPNLYDYTGGKVPFVCGDVPDWAYFMTGYNLPQVFPEIATKNGYSSRWTRSAYGYLHLPFPGGIPHIFRVGIDTQLPNIELGDVIVLQKGPDWGYDSGAEHVVLTSEIHGYTLDKIYIIEGNPVDGTIVQHTLQELMVRVSSYQQYQYLVYGHPALP